MKLGRFEEAIATYKKILAIDSKNRFALTSLGYASRAAGRDADAEKYFQRLAQVDPDLYVPYLALGDLYTARRVSNPPKPLTQRPTNWLRKTHSLLPAE